MSNVDAGRVFFVATSVVLLIGAATLSIGIGRPPIDGVHEARVLETAREMRAADDWILPTLCGEPRLRKPPLPYWGTMVAFDVAGGPSILAARCLAAGLGLLTLVATFALGRRHGGNDDIRVALVAALMLASAFLFLREFRHVTPDPWLAAAVTVAWWGAVQMQQETSRRDMCLGEMMLVFGLAAALLAKGPIAYVFVGLGVWTFRPPISLGPRRLCRTAILAVIATLPLVAWLVAVEIRMPGAFSVLGREVASRLDPVGRSSRPQRGPLVYVSAGMLMLLPWTLAFLDGLLRPRSLAARRLRTGLGLGLLFLVLLSSRKAAYLLPLLPMVALIAARAAVEWIEERRPLDVVLHRGQTILIALGSFTLFVAPSTVRDDGDFFDILAAVSIVLTMIIVVRRGRSSLVVLGIAVITMTGYFGFVRDADREAPRRRLGQWIAANVSASERVVALTARRPVVSFYARRTISTVTTLTDDRHRWCIVDRRAASVEAERLARDYELVTGPKAGRFLLYRRR